MVCFAAAALSALVAPQARGQQPTGGGSVVGVVTDAASRVPVSGAVIVVRPDQYVAAVLPLTATDELAAFFAGALVDQRAREAVR